MNYHLVFDAASQQYPLWEELLPWMIAAAFGALLIRFPNLYGQRPRFHRAFGVLLVIVGFGVAFGLWRADREQRDEVVGALQRGHFEIVEGTVEHFQPGRADSHPPEEFDVAGHHYQYAPAYQVYGFNHVAGEGGPMREGVHVRIADVDGLIARLEIAQ